MFLYPSIIVSYLVTLGIVATFCWRDAKARGKSPLTVIAVVLLAFPVGLVAWFLFRPDIQPGACRQEFDLKNYRLQ